MPSRRLLLVVELQVDHEAQIRAQSATELLELAKNILGSMPMPAHIRCARITGFPAPLSLTSEEEAILGHPGSDRSNAADSETLFNARLKKFQIEFAKAHAAIETRRGFTIDSLAIQEALVTKLDVPGTEWLPERELSASEMVALLDDVALFQALERTRTDSCILPAEILTRLDEQRRKLQGELWEIHKSDADNWPSDPHAHNVDTGFKLDLATGDLYDPRKKREHAFLRTLPKKSLLQLRALFTIPMPELKI